MMGRLLGKAQTVELMLVLLICALLHLLLFKQLESLR